MKETAKRLFALALALAMVCVMLPVSALAADNVEPTVYTDMVSYINPLYRDVITEEDLVPPSGIMLLTDVEFYTDVQNSGAVLKEGMVARQTTVSVGYSSPDFEFEEGVDEDGNQVYYYTGTALYEIVEAAMTHTGVPVEGDYLRWQYGGYWVDISMSSGDDGNYNYTFTYYLTYYTNADQEETVDSAVSFVLGELGVENMDTRYDKIKAVYGWLTANVDYDYANLEDDSYTLKNTAYGALIEETCVCQGYAVALYRLALEMGIDCRLVAGDSDGDGIMDHGWNIVQMDDGLYYNLDATWDEDNTEYYWFLLCDDNFVSHTPGSDGNGVDYTSDAFLAAYPKGETDYDPEAAGSGGDPEVTYPITGVCGEDLIWTLTEDGTLTISGTGAVTPAAVLPWYEYVDEIVAVVYEDGVTDIYGLMMPAHTNVKSITLPSNLTSLGSAAFMECSALEEIQLPETLTSIGESAFVLCTSLTEIVIPASVTYIGDMAFATCTGLTSITFEGDAPEMGGEYIFDGVTATVYYPAGNETWTEEVMQQYGGTITWVPYGEEIEQFALAGTTMSLGNSLAINFVLDTANLEGNDNYAVITKSYADGREPLTVNIPQTQWVKYSSDPNSDTTMRYFTFNGVSAKEMTDQFTVVVYNAAGQQMTTTHVDSVADYSLRAAQKELAKTNCDAEKLTLYVDMINYGAAAQTYFGYATDNLASAVLTEELKGYASENVEVTDSRIKGEGYLGTTLSLKNEILMNFVFSNAVTENAAYAAVSFTNHYGDLKTIEVPASEFQAYGEVGKYISVTSMSVADCYAAITLTLYDAGGNAITSVVDSVEGYIARTDGTDALYPEIMKFANAAYNYFH